MRTSQAIEHFGSQSALARALVMDQSSVSTWKEFPPALRQLQIEGLTGGALKAEPSCDKYRVPAPSKEAA
jgi:transcriptional repressor of cell division inhibition gene dicB